MVRWMQGRCLGEVRRDGSISITTKDLVGMETSRPKTVAESGADPAMIARITSRDPGPIDTLGFLGGAVAWTVSFDSLALLEDRLMDRLRDKYGVWNYQAYIALVRNTGAPTIWNCAEPAGGMAESPNLDLEQLCEGLELGVYNDDGWVRFLLPDALSGFQSQLDHEQAHWWQIVNPNLKPASEAKIEFLSVGQDERNGVPGIWAAGPVGDISFTRVAHLGLVGTGWRLVDTEARPGHTNAGEPPWVALRRKVVAICRRGVKAPIMFEFDPEGRLHPGGVHMILEGENRTHSISHLSTAVIQALDWF